MSNSFFSTNYRCPNCQIVQSYLDNDRDTVICDYCVNEFTKIDNQTDNTRSIGQHKRMKRKLLGRNLNQ